MSDVVNRITNQYLKSVHEPDYSLVDWIHDPDLSAVVGYGSQYWIITGDVVTLMDQAARDAVDTQILSDNRDVVANELDSIEGIMRAFAGVVLDEINTLRAVHSLPDRTLVQLKTAIRNKLGG